MSLITKTFLLMKTYISSYEASYLVSFIRDGFFTKPNTLPFLTDDVF